MQQYVIRVQQTLPIVLSEHVLHGHVQGHQRDRPARGEDRLRCFGVVPDVRLGDRGDVAPCPSRRP